MTFIPMRDLKDTVAIEKKCAETNGPIFVTKNGYGRLVVMDIDYYERTMGLVHEAKLVNDGLADIERGRVKPAGEVIKGLKEKYEL